MHSVVTVARLLNPEVWLLVAHSTNWGTHLDLSTNFLYIFSEVGVRLMYQVYTAKHCHVFCLDNAWNKPQPSQWSKHPSVSSHNCTPDPVCQRTCNWAIKYASVDVITENKNICRRINWDNVSDKAEAGNCGETLSGYTGVLISIMSLLFVVSGSSPVRYNIVF